MGVKISLNGEKEYPEDLIGEYFICNSGPHEGQPYILVAIEAHYYMVNLSNGGFRCVNIDQLGDFQKFHGVMTTEVD